MGESQAPAAGRPPQLFCGDIDIRIAGDGTWFHEGCPIGRLPLVKLFASVLRREDGDYWLVTPVEKARIAVDDVPFVAVEMEAEGGKPGAVPALPHQHRRMGERWCRPPPRLPLPAGLRREGALSHRARRTGGASSARRLLRAGGALR